MNTSCDSDVRDELDFDLHQATPLLSIQHRTQKTSCNYIYVKQENPANAKASTRQP